MRIWDINPGYLNRQSLLGEHRELHGIVSIIKNNKKGYSRHPETLRWVGHGWALRQRHRLLATEMQLRGYTDRSPVSLRANANTWPETFIDPPAAQLQILGQKYQYIEQGRIPLPQNTQQLWAQHKYSVMARDIVAYQDIGKRLAPSKGKHAIDTLAMELITLLQQPPQPHLIHNALLHMWGYVSDYSVVAKQKVVELPATQLLQTIQQLAVVHNVRYLRESTALSELGAWG